MIHAAKTPLLFLCLLACTSTAAPGSDKQKPVVKMYARESNGTLSELPREIATLGPQKPGPTDTSWIASPLAVLQEPKAQRRIRHGEPIDIISQVTGGFDPRQLELRHFLVARQERFFSLQNSKKGSPAPSTVSFRASKLPDGQWRFQPAFELPPGEYCFAYKAGNEHFCFGVDPK